MTVTVMESWKQDQNVKTKTKTKKKVVRPRPGPVKQQQDYITEKNSSVATSMFVVKNNLVQKTSKK